jgi:hypothetical protein
MFDRKIKVTILGDQHHLSRQTQRLCGRWVDVQICDVSVADFKLDYRRALDSDLILICLEQADIEGNTRDVASLVTELERANEGKQVDQIVVRTRIKPRSAARLGVHILHDYGLETWILGLNSESKPSRISESIRQLLSSAFEEGLLKTKPNLRLVNSAEAEAIWFTRLALIACEHQFFKETKQGLSDAALNHKQIVDCVIQTFPDTLTAYSPANDDLCSWIDEVGGTATPLLNTIVQGGF